VESGELEVRIATDSHQQHPVVEEAL